jgi:WD40 repeat protein
MTPARLVVALAAALLLLPAAAPAQDKLPGKGKGKSKDNTAEPTFQIPAGLHLDADGDLLPAGAVARLGSGRLRHLLPELVFSADGKTLLSWSNYQRTICYWDANTGKELRRLVASDSGRLDGLALSPDNKTLAVVLRGGPVLLLDAETGALQRRLPTTADDANPYRYTVVFAPDGRTLAFTNGKTVVLFDPANGATLRQLTPPEPQTGAASPLAFSADGKLLTGVGGQWDVGAGKLVRTPPTGSKDDYPGFLSADGKRWIAFRALELVLCDPASGEVVHKFAGATYTGERNMPRMLRLSPDGATLAALSMDRKIRFFDVATGKQLIELPGQLGYAPASLAFSPDGKTAAFIRDDSRIVLWDIAAAKERLPARGAYFLVKTLALSADGGHLIAQDKYRALALWDVKARKPVVHEIGERDHEGGFRFLPDGATLATYGRDGLHHWDPATGKHLKHVYLEPAKPLSSFAVSADGKLIAVTDGYQKVVVAETETGKALATFRDETGDNNRNHVTGLWFAQDGKTLVVTYRGISAVLDWRAGEERHMLRQDLFAAALFESPSTLLTCPAAGGDIVLWDLATGKARWREQVYFEGGGFLAEGRLVLGISGDSLHLWEAATRSLRTTIVTHHGRIGYVAVAARAPVAVTAHEDGTLLVWDLRRLGLPNGPAAAWTNKDADRLWADLANKDAKVAHQALLMLVSQPREAAPLLKQRLTALAGARAKDLAAWLGDLDSKQFKVREQATKELETAGKWAEPALRKLLDGKPPLEVAKRVEHLLTKAAATDGGTPDAAWLQALRGVEALERLGTAEAREVLEALAAAQAETWVSREARAALRRGSAIP